MTDSSAARTVRRVFLITLGLNLGVAAAKASYGILSGSIALGTDAIHALLDGSSNVLALLSLHWSQIPADARHPYGRRKIEILAALGIGVLIVIGLFEMSVAAIRSLLGHRDPPQIGWGGFAVLAATMLTNFFVTRYEERQGHALGSALLCADAQHTRSDLYASIAVALSFVGIRFGLRWADPVGAIFVVGLVGRAAWIVFRENIPTLIDAAVLDPERIAVLASEVSGVSTVSRVRTRGLRTAVHLELRIAVDPGMSVHDAHQLAEKIEDALRAAFPELSDVSIHAGPAKPQPKPQGPQE
jgi:cation diffusion facilitator family transporter